MPKVGSIAPLAATCGALLCVSLPSSGRLASKVGPAASVAQAPEAAGVAVALAEREGRARTLRMPGRVALDEARVYRVNAGMGGSIRDVLPVVTGSRVRKDQVLGSFYAPDAATELSLFVINHLGYDPETSHRNTPPGADASRPSGS